MVSVVSGGRTSAAVNILKKRKITMQNKWSVALAEKLGYHFDHEYVAYEI